MSQPDEPAADDHAAAPDSPTRPYLRVTPTAEGLDPDAARQAFTRLHAVCTELQAPDGWRDRLLGAEPATVEVCLVTEGPDATVEYYVGLAPGDDTPPERARDRLAQVLRTALPAAYELAPVSWHPDAVCPSRDDDTAAAALELRGRPERRRDWQTRLTPIDGGTETASEPDADHDPASAPPLPLGAVAAALAATDGAAVVQTCLQPLPDWAAAKAERQAAIETQQDTLVDQLVDAVVGPPEPAATTLPAADRTRREELAAKDARHSFAVSARAIAVAPEHGALADPATPLRDVASALETLGHTSYGVEATVATGREKVQDSVGDLRNRAVHDHEPSRATRLPGTTTGARALVADAAEAPALCLVDGARCPTAARRALRTTPGERAARPRPPAPVLDRYRGDGLALGRPVTADNRAGDAPIALPPALQSLHVGWFGRTGAGKSTSLITAILENHAATDGADILIDPKGDGMATDYLRAHEARYGDLDDVLYFDCSEDLPAFAFFDIRDELAAGVPRTTAVEDVADHYLDLLRAIMGRERFEQAVRAPDVLRYLVKAQFDPVHGDDAFSHRALHGAARRMHERQSAPAVSDPDLERMLAGLVANRARTFDEIMQGVANRLEKIPADERLARIFNHVPATRGPATDDGAGAGASDPHFDLAEYLNEDVVIVLDTGGLRTEAQRVLTLVVLSNLWTALRRRTRRDGDAGASNPDADATPQPADAPGAPDADADRDHPLVNCYIEEAASIAVSDLLGDLLAQARGFDCALTLSMQFPAQVRETAPDTYAEVLNNLGTVVAGAIPVPDRLAQRFATADQTPAAVRDRLRALDRGEWLARLPAGFGEPTPRPIRLRSLDPPPGDPAGDEPRTAAERRQFHERLAACRARTRRVAGLQLQPPATVDADDADDDDADPEATRVDSALPHTKRLPPTVEYDAASHALRCTECDNRYDPSRAGMERAIACCHRRDAVDPDDIPICTLNLKLTPAERRDSDWTDTQLMFLQAVYNAQQLRYEPPAYDLLCDSMLRLQEYVGIDDDAVQDLVDADLLRHDTDHPHRLYTVTPAGRDVIGEGYREGVDYGHGAGDLEESSQHVLAVEVARRYLEQTYVDDPDAPVTEIVPYYDLDDRHRLDVAGLDAEGEIRVTVEAERVNNDVRRAVPEDFDKMAACEPDEAIWVVMTQSAGHDVLQALNEPPEGAPRVEKSYASTTPPQQFRIDTPGLTAMYPVEWLRDRLDES